MRPKSVGENAVEVTRMNGGLNAGIAGGGERLFGYVAVSADGFAMQFAPNVPKAPRVRMGELLR